MKTKFIGKYCGTGYERNYVFLEYEYKGYKYTVYENLAKGNEPLAWQHRNEQDRIDNIIEQKKHESKGNSFDLDEVWDMLGWNE